jgi:uncharacterized short protein YbdD (DUF466 family)
MRRAWGKMRLGFARVWRGLREWCGDAAYERYQESARRGGQSRVLSAQEFYVEQLNKKYSRPNRCC